MEGHNRIKGHKMKRNRIVQVGVIFQLVYTETGETLSFLLSLFFDLQISD